MAPLTTTEFNTIVELVVLWKSIADDGKVSKEEIDLLGIWLERRKGVQIPEIVNVRDLFQHIVSDQRVTSDELVQLRSLIESIASELERRPVLNELPDLGGESHAEIGPASKKLAPRKKTAFAAIDVQEGSVRWGDVTWNWKQLIKQISAPLTANAEPGDCYKCNGLGVLTLTIDCERCWQCGGTGWYEQNQSRTTIEEFLDRDKMR